MPDPRLVAVITALMLIGGAQGSKAAYNLAQLQSIERLILDKTVAAFSAICSPIRR